MTQVSSPQWSIGSDGARISFVVPTAEDARRICDQYDPKKQYDMEIKLHRKKRSNDANALMWSLIGDMAEILRRTDPKTTADEIYRKYIADYGRFFMSEIPLARVDEFERIWTGGHIGRIVQRIGTVEGLDGEELCIVRYFPGSSDYSSEEMAKLIDAVLQDANAIGIDTRNDSFRSLMAQYPGGQ